jgi:predicted acylesterase/phospholipase RssA
VRGLALVFGLVALAGPAGGRATNAAAPGVGPALPLSSSEGPPPSPPSAALYRAIPNLNEQKAQREVVEEIQKAQKELQTSASGIDTASPPRSIKWIQSRAVRLVDQAARLQINDTIAPAGGAAVPEIEALLGLRQQAEGLRTAIKDEADRVRNADPTRDVATVKALVDLLQSNVTKLRDVAHEADQQIDKLRATYLSSASLVVSGGVSLGSYQAGFLHYYSQYLLAHGRYVRQVFTDDGGTSLDLVGGFKLVTGASAGSINAFLAAVAGCRQPVSEPEKSLFYRAWIPVGMDRLVEAGQVNVDGILSRRPIDESVSMIEQLWNDAGERAGWDACNAYIGVSATRLRGRTLKFPEKLGDRVDSGAPFTTMTRLTEKFALRMTGKSGEPPTFSSFRPHPHDPRDTPPAELYPTLGLPDRERLDNIDALPAKLDDVMHLLEASSSFPFAFPPVELPVTVWQEQGSAASPAQPSAKPLFVGSPEPNAKFIDGGVFDNTPLGLAIRMSDWLPEAPARFLFMVSGNVGWKKEPTEPPPVPAPPSSTSGTTKPPIHPATTFQAFGPFLSDFVSASEDTELMNTVEGHGDINRELPTRAMPVAGEQLGHFLGFFERDFRIFDFHMGMVDARKHILSHNAEQLQMLGVHANIEVRSAIFDCFQADRDQPAGISYAAIAALPACGGVDHNLIALLQASTKIERAAQAGQSASDPLQEFLDALDEFGYRFRQLEYRGSPATGTTAKRAIRDLMQDLAHDLSAKQDGVGNQFVVSLGAKAVPNLFLYRPPQFYLGVGLDTDAGGELQQGFELTQLPFASRPALRLTLSERVREIDRNRLDSRSETFTYAATFMGAGRLVLELPISNVFQVEVGGGAALLERVGWPDHGLIWRWGPEGGLRFDFLQRFYLGAEFVYYLDDCAGHNQCSHVAVAYRDSSNPITSSAYRLWLSVGARFFWFN